MSIAAIADPRSIPSSNRLFEDLPPRASGPLRPRWWALALVFHLALLMVPASVWQPEREATPPITVDLRLERPTAPPPVSTADPVEPPVPAEIPVRPVDADARAEPAPEAPVAPRPEAPAPSPEPPARPDTAPAASLRVEQLLQSVAAMDWSTPAADLSIGRPVTSETAERWSKPLLPGTSNALDGTFAPDDVEIVDRWEGPGGVHQVVIRAPDGNTYCGRQEPLNDLRPWLQMPMLFHKCAGGGKRSKGASWRNN
jgi:hypothetical protein